MHEVYDEFTSRGITVIAVAQEDTDLKKHGAMLRKLPDAIKFDVVADIGREQTKRYRRTTTYFIDKDGVVRQVFPMLIHFRAVWPAIIQEIDRHLDAP